MERLRRETGVALTEVRSIDAGMRPMPARAGSATQATAPAMSSLPLASGAFLDATRAVLARHRGLWFNDESFVVSRHRG